MHVALHLQRAHRRINDRVARLAVLPRLQTSGIVLPHYVGKLVVEGLTHRHAGEGAEDLRDKEVLAQMRERRAPSTTP